MFRLICLLFMLTNVVALPGFGETPSPKQRLVDLLARKQEKQAKAAIIGLRETSTDEWLLAWAQREYAHLSRLDGTLPTALAAWEVELGTASDDVFATGMVAQLLWAAAQGGKAVGRVDEFVARGPTDLRRLRFAAATCETFGLYDQALLWFAQLLQREPGNRNYLGAPDGWMAVIRNREEAWAETRRRLSEDDANPFLHSLAGDYARELRQYAPAAEHYRQAVAHGGGPYAQLRLAEALKALGRDAEAKSLYRTVAAAPSVPLSPTRDSRPEARRRLAELEAGQTLAADGELSAQLGREVVGHGLELVERVDSVTAPAEREGRPCRMTDSAKGGYFFRFRVNDGFLFEGDEPVVIEFDYFDEASGFGKCTVSYDSAAAYGSWMPERNGRDTEPACFYRQNTHQWKTARFVLPRARFGNRMEDYTDFRLRSFGDNQTGGDLFVSEVRLRRARPAEAATAPSLDAVTPAAGLTRRTVPLADLQRLRLAPYNMEDCNATRMTIEDQRCLRLDYFFPHPPTGDYAWVELPVHVPLPTPPRALGVRLNPQGSLCEVAFRIKDAKGELFQMKLCYQLHGYDWTTVSRPPTFLGASWGEGADSVIDYPAEVDSILIDTSRRGRSSVLLDALVIQE